MGEMADFSNEYQEETCEQLSQYKSGEMSLQDAYDNGIVDEMGVETYHRSSPVLKTCRCCNTSGLTWGVHKGKYRLFDNGKLHNCPSNKLNEG